MAEDVRSSPCEAPKGLGSSKLGLQADVEKIRMSWVARGL